MSVQLLMFRSKHTELIVDRTFDSSDRVLSNRDLVLFTLIFNNKNIICRDVLILSSSQREPTSDFERFQHHVEHTLSVCNSLITTVTSFYETSLTRVASPLLRFQLYHHVLLASSAIARSACHTISTVTVMFCFTIRTHCILCLQCNAHILCDIFGPLDHITSVQLIMRNDSDQGVVDDTSGNLVPRHDDLDTASRTWWFVCVCVREG